MDYLRKAKKQFKAGKILFENGCYSDALSRFYYALRSTAVFLLGKPENGKWKHPALMRRFVIEIDGRRLFELSRKERRLIKRFPNEREKADYDLVEVSKEKAEEYLQLVERILEEVTNYAQRGYQD